MKNNSIWQTEISKEKNSTKQKKLPTQTDILIIGAGITGLTTAYFLKNSQKKITVIDKSKVGMGITSKSTAKISYLQETIYQTLEKKFNIQTAQKYLQSQLEAIELIKKIVKENSISCNLEKSNSILFATSTSNIPKIQKEKELLQKSNIHLKEITHPQIAAGFKVTNTYTFNPLQYLKGIQKEIASKVEIYENITAQNIKKQKNQYQIETTQGIITAPIVVIACHYPFFLLPTLIPLKTNIKREYVNIIQIKNPKKDNAINVDKELHSIRYYKNKLIYTSNSHKLTNQIDYKKNYEKSSRDTQKYFNAPIQYTWMNQDIMSHDSLPFIGKIEDNLYLATAYNAWGMTNGTIAAKVITDLILKQSSPYQELFNPNRMNLPLTIGSITGIFSYFKVYIQTLFQKSNPKYIKIKGLTYAIYKDENNQIHQIKLICPHLKCNLVFNKEERTWDCPCHGSRFDIDGNVIEGPAVKNLNKK